MKKIAVLALATFAAAGAFAQSAAGGLTREQVQQEYLAARAAGQLPQAGEIYLGLPAAQAPSNLTRATVEQDLALARANGTLVPAGENEFGTTDVVGSGSVSRAQVQADAARAGHLPASLYLGG
ncbi:MAG: DUF4148 domain-containing protein [Xylophilus ampelinus]